MKSIPEKRNTISPNKAVIDKFLVFWRRSPFKAKSTAYKKGLIFLLPHVSILLPGITDPAGLIPRRRVEAATSCLMANNPAVRDNPGKLILEY
jgi:hypothetical protein